MLCFYTVRIEKRTHFRSFWNSIIPDLSISQCYRYSKSCLIIQQHGKWQPICKISKHDKSLELRPWDEWENKDFEPITWHLGNAPLNTLQHGPMKWEPSTVQNRRLRRTDTGIEDCPGDDDTVWYERDCELTPAEAWACVTHGNCKEKSSLTLSAPLTFVPMPFHAHK